MTRMNLQIDFLYSFENRQDYEASCQRLFDKYAPEGEIEKTLVSNIAIAVWNRRRYASVMHTLLRELHEESTAGVAGHKIVRLTRSIVHFNREYRHQKNHISGCRSALKRLRLGETEAKALEGLYEDFALAA